MAQQIAARRENQSIQADASQGQNEDKLTAAAEQAVTYFRDYARERPDVFAMWCFGIGFVLGWKLKPW